MHSSRQRQGGREPLRAFVSAASSGALPACGEALGQRLQAGHGDMLQVLGGQRAAVQPTRGSCFSADTPTLRKSAHGQQHRQSFSSKITPPPSAQSQAAAVP